MLFIEKLARNNKQSDKLKDLQLRLLNQKIIIVPILHLSSNKRAPVLGVSELRTITCLWQKNNLKYRLARGFHFFKHFLSPSINCHTLLNWSVYRPTRSRCPGMGKGSLQKRHSEYFDSWIVACSRGCSSTQKLQKSVLADYFYFLRSRPMLFCKITTDGFFACRSDDFDESCLHAYGEISEGDDLREEQLG